LRAILSAQAPTSASTASFNNHVGVPISLARLPREARYGVFEIGMNHPGEIEPLARQVEAHVGVITNVEARPYRSHGLGGGDRRREGLPVRRHAAGRRGSAQSRQSPLRPAGAARPHLRRDAHHRLWRHEAAEARLLACRLQDCGSDVEALIGTRRIEYRLGAAGEHWVLNSLAALAVAEAFGADLAQAAATLAEVKASPGRGARRWLKFGSGTIELLDESYNANPASMRAMLAVLARTEPAPGGRRLLAMGDMRELGGQADAITPGWPRRWRRAGRRKVFLCGPHMEALWHKLAAAQKGVHRPDSAGLAGEVAKALRRGT
jgi:UDP-N-acetylmuramoyl-tripeptide--D-alanyl-D-alanine ligase